MAKGLLHEESIQELIHSLPSLPVCVPPCLDKRLTKTFSDKSPTVMSFRGNQRPCDENIMAKLFNYTGLLVCFEMALRQGLQGQLMSHAG